MEEEITLRELIEIILKGKKLIIGITILAVLIAGIVSFFVLPEEYEAKAKIVFDKGFVQQHNIDLQSYSSTIKTRSNIESLISSLQLDKNIYTVTELMNSISANYNKETNQIIISVTGDNPNVIQKIANNLARVSTEKLALINDTEIAKAEKALEYIESQLEATPKTLEDNVNHNNLNVLINPLYEKLITRWEDTNYQLFQLKFEKEMLTEGQSRFVTIEEAPLPQEPVRPNKTLNIAIAAVLGIMVSVFIVFFLEYWRNTESKKIEE